MRILYFYRGLPRSTQLIHMRSLIEALRGLGHEIEECFPFAGGGLASGKDRLPVAFLNAAQVLANRRGFAALEERLKQFQPDLVYERYLTLCDTGVRFARAHRLPLILEVNSAYAHLENQRISPLWRGYARSLELRALRQADALIVVSQALGDYLVQLGISAEKITVMHNAIHPERFQDLPELRAPRRAELGVGARPVIVYLQEWGNFPLLAQTIALLKQLIGKVRAAFPEAVFLLVGGGPNLDKAREAALAAGGEVCLHCTGAIPHAQVPSYLAAADVAVAIENPWFTSPLKIFEYMAAGKPIVAPARKSIAEVLHDGENALLFPPGEGEALANAVVRLLRDPELAQRLANKAREQALREHSWQANAEGVIAIGGKLIA